MFHLAGPKISKYDLLSLIKKAFELDVDLVAEDDFILDRSLRSDRFQSETGYSPPSWEAMIAELASDPTPYKSWRL